MKVVFAVLCIFSVVGVAHAQKETMPDVNPVPVPCDMDVVTYDWDFAVGDQGFMPVVCDGGGVPVWEYGPTNFIPGAPGNVWGTILAGNYPTDAGHGLLSPSFTVAENSYLMEVLHYVHTETYFDGGNVSVGGQVIVPVAGYPEDALSSYDVCVGGEPGFTGNGYSGASEIWVQRCFDLTPFMGQTIQVEFDFGSDYSIEYPGWYLASVKVGGFATTPTETGSWGKVKSLYR